MSFGAFVARGNGSSWEHEQGAKMQNNLRLCVAQMTSTTHHAGNIAVVKNAARHAAEAGCHLLALPEVVGLMNRDPQEVRGMVGSEAQDPFVTACQALAKEHGIWIETGSTPIAGPDGRFLNHGNLIDDQGAIRARYDKIHLFDVSLEGQAPIGESKRYAPGAEAVLVDTPWGTWGLSICYDLRFPHLYRDYAKAGAGLVFIPSAFTVPTGQAHWEVLLRARAIETGCFVIAAAQVGTHDDGRTTYGHSLVVDPWGTVLSDAGVAPGAAIAPIDPSHLQRIRGQMPSLQHRQPSLF